VIDYNFMPIDDRRPRPPPTTHIEQLIECRLKLPLQVKMRQSTYSRQRLMRDLSRARTLVESSIVA